MKILVTGGSGYIGSAVVRQLLEAGAELRVLVREADDLRNLGGLDVELVYGDITDFHRSCVRWTDATGCSTWRRSTRSGCPTRS